MRAGLLLRRLAAVHHLPGHILCGLASLLHRYLLLDRLAGRMFLCIRLSPLLLVTLAAFLAGSGGQRSHQRRLVGRRLQQNLLRE